VGFVCNGRTEPAPGLDVSSYLDNPTLALRAGEDYGRRSPDAWIHAIVLHTTRGIPGGADHRPQDIRPGLGPSSNGGERVARWWSRDGRQAGAHIVVDFDGRIFQTCDLITASAWHCPGFNAASIGVEIVQGASAELYLGQLDVVVGVCDWLTRRFGIQRTIPHAYVGAVKRFLDGGPRDASCIVGHRDCAKNRGPGDPGSKVFYMLGAAGYTPENVELSSDRDSIRRIQRELGVRPPDGIPGPQTIEALKAAGYPHGLLVSRPGD
jgi:hypothetical protein